MDSITTTTSYYPSTCSEYGCSNCPSYYLGPQEYLCAYHYNKMVEKEQYKQWLRFYRKAYEERKITGSIEYE
jgi:hypothetical protein